MRFDRPSCATGWSLRSVGGASGRTVVSGPSRRGKAGPCVARFNRQAVVQVERQACEGQGGRAVRSARGLRVSCDPRRREGRRGKEGTHADARPCRTTRRPLGRRSARAGPYAGRAKTASLVCVPPLSSSGEVGGGVVDGPVLGRGEALERQGKGRRTVERRASMGRQSRAGERRWACSEGPGRGGAGEAPRAARARRA